MKKTLIFVSLILNLLYTDLKSQKVVGKPEDLQRFFKTKTYVVLDNDVFNIYNSAMKKAVESAWYITDYEFIKQNEFERKMSDKNSSFLVRTKIVNTKDPQGASYTFVSVVLGKPNTNFERLPEVGSFPLSYYGVQYEEYDYKLATLLLFLQHHIELTKEHPELNSKNIIQYYNKNIQKIGEKTLYFTKDDLADDVNTIEKIKKYYKGNVKIVEPEEIEKLVLTRDKNAIILHKVSPPKEYPSKDRCYKLLLGTENGELYYFDYHKITNKKPGKFLKSDFKKLNNEK